MGCEFPLLRGFSELYFSFIFSLLTSQAFYSLSPLFRTSFFKHSLELSFPYYNGVSYYAMKSILSWKAILSQIASPFSGTLNTQELPETNSTSHAYPQM